MKKLIGYHYTSLSNWKKIKEMGLRPTPITNTSFVSCFGSATVNGNWIWKRRLPRKAHIGNIIYQMSSKGVEDVVLLKVTYTSNDILPFNSYIKSITFNGNLGGLIYAHLKDIYVILDKPIPPSQIEHINTYHFKDAWS